MNHPTNAADQQHNRKQPKPPIPAPCVPVAAPGQDLWAQTAISRLEANLARMAVEADRLARDEEAAVQAVVLIEKVQAVALAAEALHAGHVRDLPAYQMSGLWQALEDALNEWRAGKC